MRWSADTAVVARKHPRFREDAIQVMKGSFGAPFEARFARSQGDVGGGRIAGPFDHR
jgi:hypothetical protein